MELNFIIKKFLEISGGMEPSTMGLSGVSTEEKVMFSMTVISYFSRMFRFGETNYINKILSLLLGISVFFYFYLFDHLIPTFVLHVEL